MTSPRSILYLDPFHGGSHARVALGLARHSRHHVRVIGMPARAWKWRMRGAALWLSKAIDGLMDGDSAAGDAQPANGAVGWRPDVIVTTDMLSLPDLKVLLPPALQSTPAVVYFHENQLTYPDRVGAERDHHFAFTNVMSALAADETWFNSAYHRDAFLEAIPPFLARFPDRVPDDVDRRIAATARVMHPGVEEAVPAGTGAIVDGREHGGDDDPQTMAPLILWNHRWEHDKDPEAFVAALEAVRAAGGRFRVAIAGQRFGTVPPVFDTVAERFAAELVAMAPLDQDAYEALLPAADIVVSTARHEFFGIAVVEAIMAGAYPLLPDRLSYPELIPSGLAEAHLYRSPEDLVDRLSSLVRTRPRARCSELASTTRARFDWTSRIQAFDAALSAIAEERGRRAPQDSRYA